MWSLVPRRLQVFAIVFAAFVIVFAVEATVEVLGGETLGLLRLVSLVVFVIGAALAPIANVLWRTIWRWFPAIQRVTFPDLSGAWKGRITTTWIDPETGVSASPIAVTVLIRQSLFSTTVRFETAESHSRSIWSRLEADPDAGTYRIVYLYDQQPRAKVRGRSARHDGFARLEMLTGGGRNRMVGQYFTGSAHNGRHRIVSG